MISGMCTSAFLLSTAHGLALQAFLHPASCLIKISTQQQRAERPIKNYELRQLCTCIDLYIFFSYLSLHMHFHVFMIKLHIYMSYQYPLLVCHICEITITCCLLSNTYTIYTYNYMPYIRHIHIIPRNKAKIMLILPAPNDPYGRPRNPGTFQIGATEICHNYKDVVF